MFSLMIVIYCSVFFLFFFLLKTESTVIKNWNLKLNVKSLSHDSGLSELVTPVWISFYGKWLLWHPITLALTPVTCDSLTVWGKVLKAHCYRLQTTSVTPLNAVHLLCSRRALLFNVMRFINFKTGLRCFGFISCLKQLCETANKGKLIIH